MQHSENVIIENIHSHFPLFSSSPFILELKWEGANPKEFVCRHVESNVGMSGDTKQDAIHDCLSMMLDARMLLQKYENHKLGPAMIQQKQILLELIREV